jgi:NADH-quinone oxidoreductase subunit M
MILVWLLVIPAAAGILAVLAARWSGAAARWVALFGFAAGLALTLVTAAQFAGQAPAAEGGRWLVALDVPWIPSLGVRFHLAMDGLSLLLVALSEFLGLIAVACSWRGIRERLGFFHACIAWSVAGMIGVFLAMDLFLFYFFWELMLVPLYFLIGIWGHENRYYAAMKFFIFTQAGGLLMLVGILGLYFLHGRDTGTYTFGYTDLLGAAPGGWTGMLLMLCFLAGFAVKLPAVPLHTWLPDAHTEAPTAGSVLLAGLVLKVGAYGLLRFILPLFPQSAHDFATVGMVLGLVGILYGAAMAFAQTDLKRLVAYTSVSHMGFVMLGVFAWNERALQGAVMQMLCHGVSTGALFVLVGDLQDRIGTREMGRMGGLWATVPRMGGVALFFALASMGLPGLGNFVAEFLVLLGTYSVSVPIMAAAAGGMILSVVYAIWIIQRVFHGPNEHGWKIPDLSARETLIFAAMILVIVWLGVYPQPVIDTARPAIEVLQQSARSTGSMSACGTAGLSSRGRAATAVSTAGQASRATSLIYADNANGGPP